MTEIRDVVVHESTDPEVVVEDADAARAALRERGVDVTDVQEYPWGRFCFFFDPDGNGWSVQEPVRRG